MPKLNGGPITWGPDYKYMSKYRPGATYDSQSGSLTGAEELGEGPFEPVKIHTTSADSELSRLFLGTEQVVELEMTDGTTRMLSGNMFIPAEHT